MTAPTAPTGSSAAQAAVPSVSFSDEAAFVAADPRRAGAHEVELGATWRRAGDDDAWRVSWLEPTGELVLSRVVGYESRDVSVLAVVPDAQALDALLDGWREQRDREDGLGWLVARLTPAPRPAA